MTAEGQYLPKRKTTRLKAYDYSSAGAYFVTLCTEGRVNLFGRIVNGEMAVNRQGKIVIEEWMKSVQIRPTLQIDEFVVMPNHFHGIVIITEERAHCCAPLRDKGERETRVVSVALLQDSYERNAWQRDKRSLSSFVAAFKAATCRRINEMRQTPREKVWQRGFYEHIIHNENDLNDTRRYIIYNPQQWDADRENLSVAFTAA
jgi:putative transposase